MLTVITGRAKSGKSEYCSREFALSSIGARNGGPGRNESAAAGLAPVDPVNEFPVRPSYFIVPEQYAVEAERRILSYDFMKGRALLHSEVLSFKRLAHRILGKYGGLAERMLTRQERTMLLTAVVADISPNLTYYTDLIRRPSEILSMMKLFDELEAYNPDKTALMDKFALLQDGSSGIRKAKLADTVLIFSAYMDEIEKAYTTSSLAIEKAVKLADENRFFEGLSVWIDEFTGFTDAELSLVSCMLRSGAEVTIGLCTSRESEPVFRAVDATLDKLKETAVDCGSGVVVRDMAELPAVPFSYRNGFLEALERSYTALKPEILTQFESGARDDPEFPLEIVAAGDPYSEVVSAAEKIRILAEKGYEYSDIAIAVRNVSDYSGYVGPVFAARGIPYFIDDTKNIYSNPAVVTVRAMLDVFIYDMDRDDVISLLKNGMIVNDRSRQDELENYILSHNMSGSRKYGRCDQEEIRKLYDLYLKLKAVFEESEGIGSAVDGLTALLKEIGLDARAREKSEALEREGHTVKAEEFRRIWNVIVDTLAMIKDLMKDRPSPDRDRLAETLKNYVETGFAGLEIGFIPQERNCVRVTGTGRSRIGAPRAVLMLGVNEGVMPAEVTDSGILRDYERKIMEEAGIGLADSSLNRAYKELFMIYSALFSASDHVYISYALKSGDDEAYPSPKVIKRILNSVPGLKVKGAYGMGADVQEEAGTTTADLHEGQNAAEAFLLDPNLSGRLLRLSDEPTLSVSQIESYNQCPMAYVLNYGLNVQERDEGEFMATDLGTIMHSVVEKGGKVMFRERDLEFTDEELERRSKELADGFFDEAVVEQYPEFDLVYSEKNKLIMKRLKNFCSVVLKAVGKQYRTGRFETLAFECTFGGGGTLPPVTVKSLTDETKNIYVKGKIDRLDAFSDGERVYVSVVDYKSSDKTVNMRDVEAGLSIQLITYMKAASGTSEAREKVASMIRTPGVSVVPGAGLYFIFGDGIESGETRTKATSDAPVNIDKRFMMDGIVIGSESVFKGLNGETDSGVVSASKRKKRPSFDDYRYYSEKVDQVIAGTGQNISSGLFTAAPKPDHSKNYHCEFCPYRAVCGAFYGKKNN
jgi:ATP-dependent helicase/nuclease subunit B